MAPKRKIGQQKDKGDSKKAKTVTFQEGNGLEVEEAEQDGTQEGNGAPSISSELIKTKAPKQFEPIFTRKSVLVYDKLRQGEVEIWMVQHPIDFDMKKLHNKQIDIDFSNKFGHAAVIDGQRQEHFYNDLPKSYKHMRGLFPVKGSLASAPFHRRLSLLQGVDPDWRLTQARNALDQGSDVEEGEEEEDEEPTNLHEDDIEVKEEEDEDAVEAKIGDGAKNIDDLKEGDKEAQYEEREDHKKKKKKKDKKDKKK